MYDLILDIAANHPLSKLKVALTPTGTCVVIGFSSMGQMLQVRFLGPWISMTGNKKIGILMPVKDNEDLNVMKELLEAGKVVPVIDRRYTFSELPEAIRYLEEGHARGKVVVSLEHNPDFIGN